MKYKTGMGRTGKWFAYQHSRAMPDIVTLAKGIASGFPMGALIAREGIEFQKSEHGSTFAGGPLACAAALATISVIRELLPDVPAKAEKFRKGLSGAKPPCCRPPDWHHGRGAVHGNPGPVCREGHPSQLCRGRKPPPDASPYDQRRAD